MSEKVNELLDEIKGVEERLVGAGTVQFDLITGILAHEETITKEEREKIREAIRHLKERVRTLEHAVSII